MEGNNFENEAPAREEASLGFSAKGRIGRGLYCIASVIWLVVAQLSRIIDDIDDSIINNPTKLCNYQPNNRGNAI